MADHVQQFMVLVQKIAATPDSSVRVPEPHTITNAFESVNDYNRVLETNLTVNYAASLDIIHRAWKGVREGSCSLDLCSGPGHLSLLQKEFLKVESVVGVDFSEPMVAVANQNAKSRGLAPQVSFEKGNVLDFKRNEKFDLITFTNASHHLGSTQDLSRVFNQAETQLKTDGIFVLTDLARLANDEITQDFVALAGKDYKDHKMDAMYDDFLASMRAAWSTEEMISAIPKTTQLNWFHLVSAGIPYFQALIAVPKTRNSAFLRESLDWAKSGLLKSPRSKADWELTKGSYYSGPLKKVA